LLHCVGNAVGPGVNGHACPYVVNNVCLRLFRIRWILQQFVPCCVYRVCVWPLVRGCRHRLQHESNFG
jgi:hypothetical protein